MYTNTTGSFSNATEGPYHRWIISQYGGVSVHHRRSQMTTVMVMTITVDSLLPRPKLDYDGGYDMAVKGASVVVEGSHVGQIGERPCPYKGGESP